MHRARARKIVAALPPLMHPAVLDQALKNVRNNVVRRQLATRYFRRERAS